MSIVTRILLGLIVIQLVLICISAIKGIYKYFLLRELDLRGRYGRDSWVAITGASSGQGYDMAVGFAERGFNLLLIGSPRTSVTQDFLRETYPHIETRVIYKDFRDAYKDDFFDDISAEFTKLGHNLAILVNNVGHRVGWKPYHTMPSKYIRDVISTGTIVQSRLTQMAIPYFLERKKQYGKPSALINITAQCMHPNLLFGITSNNEISVPYLSVYEAANAYGFYHGNSIYKEYKDEFDILNITPGAVITSNTRCLEGTIFNVSSTTFVEQIMKMIGQVQGHTCAYWGHALSNYLINLAPFTKDSILEKVGHTLATNYMSNHTAKSYDITLK
jgi:short-subunit dehydrogenase